MPDQLRVDTVVLREAGASLRAVAQEFDDANAHSDTVAESVGHEALAHCVRSFAHGWDDRRAKMVDAIAGLAEACSGIGEGFEDLDSQFAGALRGETP